MTSRRPRGELAEMPLQIVARRETADVEAATGPRAITRKARMSSRADRPAGSGYFWPP